MTVHMIGDYNRPLDEAVRATVMSIVDPKWDESAGDEATTDYF